MYINLIFFSAVFEEISDDDKAFEHCMEDIILKLSNVETMIDANEATRCEFISSILHASIAIAKKLTSQDIFIVLQKEVGDSLIRLSPTYPILLPTYPIVLPTYCFNVT